MHILTPCGHVSVCLGVADLKKRCARKGFEGALAACANLRKVIFLTFSAILLEFDKRLVKPGFKREVIMPLLFTEREREKKNVLCEAF